MIKNLFSLILIICFCNFKLSAQNDLCSSIKSRNNTILAKTNGGIQETLMNNYDVKFQHLNLNVERTSTYISGWVRTLALSLNSLDTFAFELHSNLSLDSVISGTQKLTTTHVGNYCYSKFPSTVATAVLMDLKIYYHGTPPTPGSGALGAGFSNGTDGSGAQITWSLSQPYSAEEWFPCKQSLHDKIDSVYVYVTTDSTNKVGSNGTLKNTVIVGNKKRYEWKQIFPIDNYLISVAVGKYYDYSIYAYPVNTPPVLIQNYIYDVPSVITNMKPQFDKTKSMIELYCKLFGPYAFAKDKYGHSMAPIGGGMEHQTMTTIGVINFTVVSHELGHQWFGDAVTCSTWSDIWVNEGFATYTAYLAYQYLDSANAMAYMVNSHNTVMGSPNGSIWFTDTTNVGRIFDNRLTYQKGSSMIHMIRFELNNDTLFFNILKEYIRRFKGSTASALDFKKVVEDLSGKNFTQFYNQWFYGEGYPTFNVFWNQIGTRLGIINAQSTSFPSSISLFKTPVEYKIKTTKGDTTIRVFMQKNVEGIALTIKDSVISVQVDPSNWLLCKTFSARDPNQLPLGISGGIEDKDNFILYPNPTNDFFTIETNEIKANMNYSILDATGRIVKNGMLTGNLTTIDICNFSTGLYLIQIGNQKQTYKLLKN